MINKLMVVEWCKSGEEIPLDKRITWLYTVPIPLLSLTLKSDHQGYVNLGILKNLDKTWSNGGCVDNSTKDVDE